MNYYVTREQSRSRPGLDIRFILVPDIDLIMNRTRVLIVGSSFISRLTDAFNNVLRSDFNLLQCTIRCFGQPGGRIDNMQGNHNLEMCINNFQPTVIILQVGGNDLCTPAINPETLACNAIDWMNSLCDNYQSVQMVVFCELFARTNPWYISDQVYEQRRHIVNRMMPVLVEAEDNKLYFWKHLRLMNSPLNIYDMDGVHLSPIGMKQFHRSLRLHALDYLD